MNEIVTDALASAGASLVELVGKQTVTNVQTKIETLKNNKDLDSTRAAYDEIVNQLLQEREDALRIAQVYKGELERIEISDEDIERLQNTVERLLDVSAQFSGNMDDSTLRSLNLLKDLINADTLKTMQLLGFNFKEAIGQPLTEACASAIGAWATSTNAGKQSSVANGGNRNQGQTKKGHR